MDTAKPSNSDASSRESDNQPEKEKEKEKSNDDTTGVGRSYECIFCKRGFTNAQALGGHMNIHRKDKAKAKKKNQEETSNKSNSRYMSHVSTTHVHDHRQPLGFQMVEEGGQMSYQVYLPSQNPNFQTENYLPLWQSDRFEGRVAANLSRRIGISTSNDKDGEGGDVDSNMKENDVDLELRLGHQP